MKNNFTPKERLDLLYKRTKWAGTCRLWSGPKIVLNKGKLSYGMTSFKSKSWLTHRLFYFLETGRDPGKMFVMHKCDNGLCVNIDHLSLGTAKDNSLDASRKGRLARVRRTHCSYGHAMTPDNTLIRGDKRWPSSFRYECRICKKIKGKEWRSSRKR